MENRLSDLDPFTICTSKAKKYILLQKDSGHIIYYMEDDRNNFVQQSEIKSRNQNASVTTLELPKGNHQTICDVRYEKEEYEEFREMAIGYLLAFALNKKNPPSKKKEIARITAEAYYSASKQNDFLNQKRTEAIVAAIFVDNENDIQRLNPILQYATPEVKETIIKKIERGIIAQKIKRLYDYKCKICEALEQNPHSFKKTDETYYIETHHIIPVSELKPGLLASSNLITLCANHHRQVHYGNVSRIENTADTLHLTIDNEKIMIQKKNFSKSIL